jgi:hypothetical protein
MQSFAGGEEFRYDVVDKMIIARNLGTNLVKVAVIAKLASS